MHDCAFTIPLESTSRPSVEHQPTFLNQVGDRQGWFTRARHFDHERGTRYGTLSYLPPEIRQIIYRMVIDCHYHNVSEESGQETDCNAPQVVKADVGSWNQTHPPSQNESQLSCSVFELRCYHWSFRKHAQFTTLLNIRIASPTIHDEFYQLYFSNIIFKFETPNDLIGFLDHPTTYQHHQLRNIQLVLLNELPSVKVPHNYKVWMKACYHLASKLTPPASVKLELGRRVIYFMDSGGWSTGTYSSYPNIPCEDTIAKYGPPKIDGRGKVAELLGVLTKILVRCAPEVEIGMTGTGFFAQSDLCFLDAIFDELE